MIVRDTGCHPYVSPRCEPLRAPSKYATLSVRAKRALESLPAAGWPESTGCGTGHAFGIRKAARESVTAPLGSVI